LEELMRVEPLADGSLLAVSPDEATRFDMGNQAVFAAFNGRGDMTRLLSVAGFDPGRWRLSLEAGGQPIEFGEGRAIGRLWQLRASTPGLHVGLTSFLDESTEAAYQRLTLENTSSEVQRCALTLDLRFGLPAGRWARAQSIVARNLPRLPGLQRLWGRGWAKVIQPDSAQAVAPAESGGVAVQGARRWTWGASRRPAVLTIADLRARARFEMAVPPGESYLLDWTLVQGDEHALCASLARSEEALRDAVSYADWLRACLPLEEPLLQSLAVGGLNAAVSMFKVLPDGFSGLLAGPDYAYPPRLYFRAGYWTAQALLGPRPDLVRRHLLSVARGIGPDGACPSGVLAPHLLRAWGRPMAGLDWLPDHYDAPAYFVLLLHEYVQTSQDTSLLQAEIEGGARTMWQAARQALIYLTTRDRDGDGVIEKPYQANDWADNVRRSTWVTYDQALYAAGLRAGAGLAALLGESPSAEHFRMLAAAAQQALHDRLWDEELGYYINYTRPGFTESHFSIDTLLALYYGLVEPTRARRVLEAARQLQTRTNTNQPYGDWGVMCVYPPYRRREDLFSISAQPYRYHNGADWPYWDAVYAEVLARDEDPDWRYVLSRWWEYSLERGWLTPVEYFSPAYPVGGRLQGWSAMAAAVLGWRRTPVSREPTRPDGER